MLEHPDVMILGMAMRRPHLHGHPYYIWSICMNNIVATLKLWDFIIGEIIIFYLKYCLTCNEDEGANAKNFLHF